MVGIPFKSSKLHHKLIIGVKSDHTSNKKTTTVLPAKSDSDLMFPLQSYQGLKLDLTLEY